jgi:threonine synthase
MQRRLAASEGLFVELASAAPLVAIQHLRKRRVIAAHDRVVAVVTASGLKDVDISAASAGCSAPFENVEQALQWIGRQSETERVVSAH